MSGRSTTRPLARRLRSWLRRTAKRLASRSPRFKAARRRLIGVRRTVEYALMRATAPIDDRLVIFESYVGWSYACSPKALYEAMRSDPRFEGFELVWAFRDPAAHATHPELRGATLVKYGSRDYYRAHSRAKYWISNSVVPVRMKVRADQVYVQTWHGTPIKRLGCDLAAEIGSGARYDAQEKHKWYRAEGRRFTHLLTQSAFASERLASAFDLEGPGRMGTIIEEGYPRNDALALCAPDDVRRVRAALGIPEGKRALLYAPTWRDDQHAEGGGYALEPGIDFGRLRAALGEDYVVLFRAHYLVASSFDFAEHEGFVIDVSGVEDVNDAAIAADVLISDYSSLIFDFAVLGRPIIAHMYDLDHYQGSVRGLYLGPDDMPGLVTRTTGDLIDAVRAVETPDPAAAERLERFRQRFARLDDGHASQRVLDRVFPIGEGAGRRS